MYKSILLGLAISLVSQFASADEIKGIRPSYGEGVKVVPINIESIHVDYTFDVANKTAIGESVISFEQLRDGHPSFDLEREILSASLNGIDVTSKIKEVKIQTALQSTLFYIAIL